MIVFSKKYILPQLSLALILHSIAMSTYLNKLLVLVECNVNGIKPGLNLDQAPMFLNIL
jgi:hypothetical protein